MWPASRTLRQRSAANAVGLRVDAVPGLGLSLTLCRVGAEPAGPRVARGRRNTALLSKQKTSGVEQSAAIYSNEFGVFSW